jgi:hypothetical protein
MYFTIWLLFVALYRRRHVYHQISVQSFFSVYILILLIQAFGKQASMYDFISIYWILMVVFFILVIPFIWLRCMFHDLEKSSDVLRCWSLLEIWVRIVQDKVKDRIFHCLKNSGAVSFLGMAHLTYLWKHLWSCDIRRLSRRLALVSTFLALRVLMLSVVSRS